MTAIADDRAATVRARSLFLQLRAGRPTREIYRRVVDLSVVAEDLGFTSIWLATRHFGAHHAAAPTAFPILAAVAQHTRRIRLGTAVVALPFENAVRLTEDAAVTDHLVDRRLELGVGKGLGFGHSASAYSAFGLSVDDREALYDRRLAELHDLLATGLVDGGVPICPSPTDIRGRVWQSTGNADTARRAGAAGDGLLPHPGSEAGRTTGIEAVVGAYLETADAATARVGVTLGVLPGVIEDLLDIDRVLSPDYYSGTTAASDPGRFLGDARVAHGSIDEVVTTITRTQAPERATEWLFSVPLTLEHPAYVDTLHTIATSLAPALDDAVAAVDRR
ncbi:LLM class flavin-dependent oxidoreductase [Williamsia deligens]|uniref:LLM class flavin-dependent oxidoreductase n=1 Tax=Williamsia deligens TaxID=321325 RepID=A0ABW3G6S6_9NOCA|nr:LLM class flavin-dependent oxidoreductase [Williamsia deligens]MCP2192946.1 Luciferase-like monooxygenase [Williamsia deligens]